MRDRLPAPGKANRVRITQDDGKVIEGVLSYADDAVQEGSYYNRANVLPDNVCEALYLNKITAEPKDAFLKAGSVTSAILARSWNYRMIENSSDDPIFCVSRKFLYNSKGSFLGYNYDVISNKVFILSSEQSSGTVKLMGTDLDSIDIPIIEEGTHSYRIIGIDIQSMHLVVQIALDANNGVNRGVFLVYSYENSKFTLVAQTKIKQSNFSGISFGQNLQSYAGYLTWAFAYYNSITVYHMNISTHEIKEINVSGPVYMTSGNCSACMFDDGSTYLLRYDRGGKAAFYRISSDNEITTLNSFESGVIRYSVLGCVYPSESGVAFFCDKIAEKYNGISKVSSISIDCYMGTVYNETGEEKFAVAYKGVYNPETLSSQINFTRFYLNKITNKSSDTIQFLENKGVYISELNQVCFSNIVEMLLKGSGSTFMGVPTGIFRSSEIFTSEFAFVQNQNYAFWVGIGEPSPFLLHFRRK